MPRNYTRRNDNGLEELAALAQIQQSFQAPQLRQQEAGQQNALQILGLAMRAQEAEQMRGLEEKRLNEASGQYWGGRYPLEQQQVMDQRAHYAALEGLQRAGITQRGEEDKASTMRVLASSLFSNPNISPTDALGMIGAMGYDPANKAVTAMHDQALQSGVRKLTQSLQGQYNTHQKNIPELNTILGAMQSTTSPEVWNAVDWNTLNAALPETAVPPAASAFSSPHAFGSKARGYIDDFLFGALDVPSTAYNYSVVPFVNTLGGAIGSDYQLPKAGGFGSWWKNKVRQPQQ